jgi:ribosomal-protein-alanine N-acetyltransferase
MTVNDLAEVCRIENDTFPNPWPKSAFEQDIQSESTYCPTVRDSSGSLVGYACLMIVADEANITNIAVVSDRRMQGIGGLLMDRVISRARNDGCRAVFLEVRKSNAGAIGFYMHYEFKELYRRRNYYRHPREDAIVMVLPIGERNSHG